ncbi:MAG: hypothetical protein ACTSYJ_00570 [Candidatus Thorarchaeota archaeon]
MDKKAIFKNLDYINLNTQRIKVFTKRITNQSDKNKPMTDKRLKKIDQKADRIKYLIGAIREQINESEPSKLKIQDDKLYFLDGGKEQFLGVGVWRREALCLETGQEGYTWKRCDQNYSLSWAEREFHKYGLNYLRTDICNNPSLVRSFCERMYNKNVVVELTLRDGVRDLGNIEATIEATKDLKNVIYECWNELYSEDDVHKAVNLAHKLRNMGLIVSGGAIGAGGEKWAEYARERGLYDIVSIIQVHRHWPMPGHEDNDWILKYKHFGKPIGRNEFFDRRKLGLKKTKFIFEKSIEHGASLVNYYGFRMPGFGSKCGVNAEGNPYYKYLEIASEVLIKYSKKAKH